MTKRIGFIKPGQEQMEDIISELHKRGIKVKVKEGYGKPSKPYWSASIGKIENRELVIK